MVKKSVIKTGIYVGALFALFFTVQLMGKNPIDSLRSRSLIGLKIMSDFKQTGNNVWTGGAFYMPKEGKTVSPELTLLDSNRINVEISFFIFSKSVVLRRVNKQECRIGLRFRFGFY